MKGRAEVRRAVGKLAPPAVKNAVSAISARSSRSHRRELAGVRRFAVDRDRVYFVHVRKCAGTSLVNGVLGADGGDGPAAYRRLTGSKEGWIELDGRVIVGWRKFLIDEGYYHFGFSHSALHEVKLPPGTFTITSLRDPSARVISHYRMLRHFAANTPDDYALKLEGPWLGSGLSDFLTNIPREHLLRQLYVFSRRFDVNEAADRIQGLDHVMFVEEFAAGIARLEERLGITMPQYNEKRYDVEITVSDAERDRLRELLEPEYDLLARIGHPYGEPRQA